MKLYDTPGACSLSPHIALLEAGMTFDTERVDLKQKKTAAGYDFYELNPKGYVPAFVLDDGSGMTEGPVIVQCIADRVPAKKLAPFFDSADRYRLQEWLTFINCEGMGQDILGQASLIAFKQRLAQRASVQQALAAEGLLNG